MLGADRGGNVFVGPTLPFGMAKPGPDYGTMKESSWFKHDQLIAGGELRLTMTDKPTHWDTGSPPPSKSDR
jgi:putative alpha-1,2-mannosidase